MVHARRGAWTWTVIDSLITGRAHLVVLGTKLFTDIKGHVFVEFGQLNEQIEELGESSEALVAIDSLLNDDLAQTTLGLWRRCVDRAHSIAEQLDLLAIVFNVFFVFIALLPSFLRLRPEGLGQRTITMSRQDAFELGGEILGNLLSKCFNIIEVCCLSEKVLML